MEAVQNGNTFTIKLFSTILSELENSVGLMGQ